MKKCILRNSELNFECDGIVKNNIAYIKTKDGKLHSLVEDYYLTWGATSGLREIKVNNKWGYADVETGEIAIPPQWNFVCDFYDGYAHVANNYYNNRRTKTGKHGIINTNGEYVLPIEYNYCSDSAIRYTDGETQYLFIVAKDGLYGVINNKNKIIIPLQYSKISYEGFFICKKDKKYGALDLFGNVVLPFEYSEISYKPHGDNFICKIGRRYGVVDLSGREIVPFKYTVYRYDSETKKYSFGVMYKIKKRRLTTEGRLLKVIFPEIVAHEDEFYTYFREKWLVYYDEDFNKTEEN